MYLVLARRINESIKIGEDIVIKIAEIQGSQVKLAISAPAEYKISRVEK
jgi:carbon storage regulator